MKQNVLAIDLGASGGKSFVGSFDGESFSMKEIHRFEYEGVPFFNNSNGNPIEQVFWDDIFIYRNIITSLKKYAKKYSEPLQSIGIDTWGADGQFIDKNADLLNKIYHYRDHRLDDMVQKLKSRMDSDKVYEITGIHFQPFNLSNQLLWTVMNRPEQIERAETFLPIPTLLNYYICGSKCVDTTWASITQLMNAERKEWSTEILKALKIPKKLLPKIVEPGSVLGNIYAPLAELTGIDKAKVIAVGSHDTASAFASAPIEDPEEALIISSGTWSLVGCLVPKPITTHEASLAGLSNEGGIGNIRLLRNCMGTWIMQELRRKWRDDDGEPLSWTEIEKMSQEATPFKSFIDPDDKSFYNPTNMEHSIIQYCKKTGQPVPENRSEILRTVYESLPMKYRYVNEIIKKAADRQTKCVHIVGGGCKDSFINQLTANALGIPVYTGPEDATAVGNIMVQACGLGIIDNIVEAQSYIKKSFIIGKFFPENSEIWSLKYKEYKKICGL
ncbi:MAG: FGGY family carbohydrate kinase [Verrucomicrobiota bacterium]|nr:FGGY family carbohydrate kinase [Verrucomicrobiota bacterium]